MKTALIFFTIIFTSGCATASISTPKTLIYKGNAYTPKNTSLEKVQGVTCAISAVRAESDLIFGIALQNETNKPIKTNEIADSLFISTNGEFIEIDLIDRLLDKNTFYNSKIVNPGVGASIASIRSTDKAVSNAFIGSNSKFFIYNLGLQNQMCIAQLNQTIEPQNLSVSEFSKIQSAIKS